jgi:hypothetical protein
MSLQSERLLAHMQRLRLSHLPSCYETLAEAAAEKNLPHMTLDFLEQVLDAESAAKRRVLRVRGAGLAGDVRDRRGCADCTRGHFKSTSSLLSAKSNVTIPLHALPFR